MPPRFERAIADLGSLIRYGPKFFDPLPLAIRIPAEIIFCVVKVPLVIIGVVDLIITPLILFPIPWGKINPKRLLLLREIKQNIRDLGSPDEEVVQESKLAFAENPLLAEKDELLWKAICGKDKIVAIRAAEHLSMKTDAVNKKIVLGLGSKNKKTKREAKAAFANLQEQVEGYIIKALPEREVYICQEYVDEINEVGRERIAEHLYRMIKTEGPGTVDRAISLLSKLGPSGASDLRRIVQVGRILKQRCKEEKNSFGRSRHEENVFSLYRLHVSWSKKLSSSVAEHLERKSKPKTILRKLRFWKPDSVRRVQLKRVVG